MAVEALPGAVAATAAVQCATKTKLDSKEQLAATQHTTATATAAAGSSNSSPRCGLQMSSALSAFGLMADIYDFGIINLVRPILEAEFGRMDPNQDSMLTGAALIGAVLGQVFIGAFADHIGRRQLFVCTAALIAVASVGSALATPSSIMGIYTTLAFWRLAMGLGIGGEYPLAAANTVENIDAKNSGLALSSVFAGMAVGQILGPMTVILLMGPLGVPQEVVWRIAFGFGAVLALMCAALRVTCLKETESFRRATEGVRVADVQVVDQKTFVEKTKALWTLRRALAGTAGSWLLYDVVTYGVGLFTTTIFPAAPGMASAKTVLMINVLALPGFLFAIVLASSIPMRHIQVLGLSAMMACFVLLVCIYNAVDRMGYIFLGIFSFQRCVDAMGPGMGTFCIPGQIFPTRIRGTAHGLSAAAGKVGAVIGTAAFTHIYRAMGLQAVMMFMAGVSAFTLAWTLVFVPLYDARDLEDIAKYDKGTTLAEQAIVTERILFGRFRTDDPGEAASLSSTASVKYGSG